jgi:Flp pilus assembly protein TadG
MVAPIFMLLVFGMIEFGRAIMVQQILTNAAREGARLAVLDSPTAMATTVKTTVVNYMHSCGIAAATAANVTITPSEPSTAVNGTAVTVTIQIPYSSVSLLPHPWFLSSKNLNASCVMRRESI